MESKFTLASNEVKNLKEDPFTNDQKLNMYSLYKVATMGKCDTAKPGMFNMTAKAKWNAWNDQGDKTKEDAQTEYVAFVKPHLPADIQAQL